MTRHGRLSSARATRWVEKYEGENIIAGYANWFAIDPLCAVMELRMLGVKVDPERENRIKASIEARAAARNRRQESRAQAELEGLPTNLDENFAYIAGYTLGGVPYGTTLEELEEEPPCVDDENGDIEQTAPAEATHLGARSAVRFGGRSADVAQPPRIMIAANRAQLSGIVRETLARHIGIPGEELGPGTDLLADLRLDSGMLYRILVDLERQLGLDPLDGDWCFEGSSVDAVVDYYMRKLDLETRGTEPNKRMHPPR